MAVAAARAKTSGGRPAVQQKPAPKRPVAATSVVARAAMRVGPPAISLGRPAIGPAAAPVPGPTGRAAPGRPAPEVSPGRAAPPPVAATPRAPAAAPAVARPTPGPVSPPAVARPAPVVAAAPVVGVPGASPSRPALAPPVSARAGLPIRPGAAAPNRAPASPAGPAVPVQEADPIGAKVAPDEVDLSTGEVAIPEAAAQSVKDGGDLDVKVRLPGLAEGTLRLRKRVQAFATVGGAQGIVFRHPALRRFAAATPMVLALEVKEGKATGWIGLGAPGPVKGGKSLLGPALAKGADLLGWAGLSQIKLPSLRNQFEGGALDVGVDNLAFTVGGYLAGTGAFSIDNKGLALEGSAKVTIPGGSGGELLIKRDNAGALAGKLDMVVALGSVTGTVTATLARGFVSVMGSVAYTSDRLSGKVTLVATDEATARDVTLKKPEGGGDVPIELPGPDKPARPGPRAFCGWGQLTFRVNEWLAGTAAVIVNSKGQATIVGEIAPPKEIVLFEQKEWIKRLFKLEIRAGYGIPVVGQVGLFANIGLDAIAKVGPGKLYNIKLAGAYSTDPRVPKQLSLEATLNISAFAGLRLRAEAGLVVTIIGHDIKAGVALDAYAGVRGYVEATPRIGMREPVPGKREYYIQGHLEIAAQPVLGFGGELFVAIETPWWSPLSDKRWTWPLFSIEYPLPGEFGIGANVDYVLGSRKWPSIEFGEVDFDGSKFLTDVMNDNTDSGHGGEEKKPGEWKEGLGGEGPGGAKNKGGSGKKPGALGADDEPVGESESFSDGKESHRLWFAEKPGEARLMVASAESPVEQELTRRDKQVDQLLEGDRPKARKLIADARKLLPEIADEATRVAAMKEAERRAEEAYKKYGKKKGKKGKKDSRKDKNKKLKSDERKLEEVLKNLFSLMRMEPWQPLKRDAQWTAPLRGAEVSGHSVAEIAAVGKTAGLKIDGHTGTKDLGLIVGGPVGSAKNPAGRTAATLARTTVDKEHEAVKKIPIVGGSVQKRALDELVKIADRLSSPVETMGKALKIPRLGAGARSRGPMSPAWPPIVFNVSATKNPKYAKKFDDELKRQLRDQQAGLNRMSVDTWVARVNTYRSKAVEDFLTLDRHARAAVAAELRERLAAARDDSDAEARAIKRAEDSLQEFLVGKNLKKLTSKQKRYLHFLKFSVDQAKQLHATREKLELFEQQHPDLAKLSPDEKAEFVKLARAAKMVGRTGQEQDFADVHAAGLKDAKVLKAMEDLWTARGKAARSMFALLHNPDQVAGGHGAIDSLAPIKIPEKPPEDASEPALQKYDADYKKYVEALKKYVGLSSINSSIGSGWGHKIGDLHTEVTHRKNYYAPLYALWHLNFTLSSLYK